MKSEFIQAYKEHKKITNIDLVNFRDMFYFFRNNYKNGFTADMLRAKANLPSDCVVRSIAFEYLGEDTIAIIFGWQQTYHNSIIEDAVYGSDESFLDFCLNF